MALAKVLNKQNQQVAAEKREVGNCGGNEKTRPAEGRFEASNIICPAFERVADRYEGIVSDEKRRRIRSFMASERILRVEDAVREQVNKARAARNQGRESDAREHIENVRQGMEWWERAVMKQMEAN